MYAIVDIETTGSFAAANGITELAIVLHDGTRVVDRFESLVNPGQPIPRYIQALTGIDDRMTADAPFFGEIAATVFSLLEDAIFVAHNVNFDYSFIKYQLEQAGFTLESKRLCTVRLARKVFPGLPGYSLGKLCRELNIEIENRHRAGGDADATALLFERILARDSQGHLGRMLRGRNRDQYLPPNLPEEQIAGLPYTSGVYYFHDAKDKVIYVGKAKSLRHRVCSHFSNNHTGLRKQEFLRSIHRVSWKESGTELMAFLLECIEIKRLWPKYNSSLKKFDQLYGLYGFEDRNGYLRLTIEKKKMTLPPYYCFNALAEGQEMLRKLIRMFGLCPKLCFLQTSGQCTGLAEASCSGACEQRETAPLYNERVSTALQSLSEGLPSFFIRDRGRTAFEESCILIEKGRFYGMGFLDRDLPVCSPDELKDRLTVYPENDYLRSLVYQFAEKYPAKKMSWVTTAL